MYKKNIWTILLLLLLGIAPNIHSLPESRINQPNWPDGQITSPNQFGIIIIGGLYIRGSEAINNIALIKDKESSRVFGLRAGQKEIIHNKDYESIYIMKKRLYFCEGDVSECQNKIIVTSEGFDLAKKRKIKRKKKKKKL